MLFVIGVLLGLYKNYLGILENPIERMAKLDGVNIKFGFFGLKGINLSMDYL